MFRISLLLQRAKPRLRSLQEFEKVAQDWFPERKVVKKVVQVEKPIITTPKPKEEPLVWDTNKTVSDGNMTDVGRLYAETHEFEPKQEEEDASWYDGAVINASEELPRWLKNAQRNRDQEIDGNELVDILAREAAQNISVIDVRAKCDHVDYMIICEGRSTKQVYSIADAVKRWAKHSYTPTHNMPHNLQVQGSESEDWMVVDLGDVIVHAFTPEARLHYDLDGLWTQEASELAQ